jgi:hypothetical protein
LIADNPEGAWTTAALCQHVYGVPCSRVEKKHRVAVIRAIRRMELPPLWRVGRADTRWADDSLYNAGSEESTLWKDYYDHVARWNTPFSFEHWKSRFPYHSERARQWVAAARYLNEMELQEQRAKLLADTTTGG